MLTSHIYIQLFLPHMWKGNVLQTTIESEVKVKAIPLQDPRVPVVWGSEVLRQCGKIVSPTSRPSLHRGKVSGTHFC
jgi:hypothetical protein